LLASESASLDELVQGFCAAWERLVQLVLKQGKPEDVGQVDDGFVRSVAVGRI